MLIKTIISKKAPVMVDFTLLEQKKSYFSQISDPFLNLYLRYLTLSTDDNIDLNWIRFRVKLNLISRKLSYLLRFRVKGQVQCPPTVSRGLTLESTPCIAPLHSETNWGGLDV